MSSNIDKSLDEIVKANRAKRKRERRQVLAARRANKNNAVGRADDEKPHIAPGDLGDATKIYDGNRLTGLRYRSHTGQYKTISITENGIEWQAANKDLEVILSTIQQHFEPAKYVGKYFRISQLPDVSETSTSTSKRSDNATPPLRVSQDVDQDDKDMEDAPADPPTTYRPQEQRKKTDGGGGGPGDSQQVARTADGPANAVGVSTAQTKEDAEHEWRVRDLGRFLCEFRVRVDANAGISQDQAMFRLAAAAWTEDAEGHLAEFASEAPRFNTWFCFDRLVENGYYGDDSVDVRGQCFEHRDRECFQVCNGGRGYGGYRTIICRISGGRPSPN